MQKQTHPVDEYDSYDVLADELLWKETSKEVFDYWCSWDDKKDYGMNEWRAYCNDHMERWGYTEESLGHRYEVKAQYNGEWVVFKFTKRVDATAELRKMLSNNVCAVLSEVSA